MLDAGLERSPGEGRGAPLGDARLQPHLQHVGLGGCKVSSTRMLTNVRAHTTLPIRFY